MKTYQYDTNGDFVAEYESIHAASIIVNRHMRTI
ncbi:MAG: hypothetical protein IJ193_01520 [Bacilli bacterium]|nr:hypothetical protein [Bacilli bacterium]